MLLKCRPGHSVNGLYTCISPRALHAPIQNLATNPSIKVLLVDIMTMAEAHPLDIVVIGAGISGLTAAGALGRQGHRVVVGFLLVHSVSITVEC